MPMKRALVLTVGTGTRPDVYIVKPLVKSIRDSRPDFLVLVVTEGSRKHGEAIVRELALPDNSFQMSLLRDSDFDDFQAVFRHVNKVFRRLKEAGFSRDEIQLDFTTGTKAMSAGAVYSAIYHQCQSIKYITGERRDGVVIDGSERFLTVNPSEIYALRDIGLAADMIRRLRFAAAEQILAGVSLALLDRPEARAGQDLKQVALLYKHWDLFEHSIAARHARNVDWSTPECGDFALSADALGLLDELGKPEKDRSANLMLCDLFNNADRRAREARYDDAVARLYRTAELFAQWILARPPYEIQTHDVNVEQVPEPIRERIAKNRAPDGTVKIGLVMDYYLLDALGHPCGTYFVQDSRLQSLLTQRNSSILAHGLTPVSRRLYRSLQQETLTLLLMEFQDFGAQAAAVQFPWLLKEEEDKNGSTARQQRIKTDA